MSWKPQFGASHTVQASQVLPSKTVVSEDDSVVINVETTCDTHTAAYASVMFTAESMLNSKVVLLKQGKSSKHLKGQLKATELKPLVCSTRVYCSSKFISRFFLFCLQVDLGTDTLMLQSMSHSPCALHVRIAWIIELQVGCF